MGMKPRARAFVALLVHREKQQEMKALIVYAMSQERAGVVAGDLRKEYPDHFLANVYLERDFKKFYPNLKTTISKYPDHNITLRMRAKDLEDLIQGHCSVHLANLAATKKEEMTNGTEPDS